MTWLRLLAGHVGRWLVTYADDDPLLSLHRIEVVTVGPDDVIVLSTDKAVSAAHAEHIRRSADLVWPGRKVAVIDQGTRLSVLHPEVSA